MQIAPKDGVNYFHRSFSDTDHLRPYGKHQSPPYPRSHDPMYKAGGSLNRILRHQIGRSEHPQSRHRTIKCNEGGWVLLEDLLLIDGIWHDGEKYDHNKSRNPNYAMKIAAKRTGWIVSLTVGEARTKGKNRFQILSLRATDNEEVIQAIKQYEITPPLPGDDVVKNYDGWLMPIAVRATSGHSMDNSSMVPINPYSFIRRLDLKSALQLQGAFHVTSPQNLKSILKYGIVPGGNERNRLMTYFGVFAPWDARNRCTRHKSPYEGDDYMVVIYIPPSELSRFGAGVSGNGDILVDKIIPPEEIKEIWIAMNCRPERDEQGYWRNVVTRPWKIFSKKLDDEIVTYSDFQKLGRSGIIAPREQIIDGAEQLIKRFPRAPVGDPDDLEELKEDVKTLKSTRGTLKLENETRARVVMKLALYQKSAGNQTLGVRNIKCPCCLQETTSCLAICLECNSEFWSAGRYERTVPEQEEPKSRIDREKIIKKAREAARITKETIDKMSNEERDQIHEDEMNIEEEVNNLAGEDVKQEEHAEESFAKDEPVIDEQKTKEDLSMFERDLVLPMQGALCEDSNMQAAKYMI